MKSPSRRRTALAALLLAPTLAACGFNVQTDQVYQPAEGVNNRSGEVDVLNATVVSDVDGSGTFAGTLVNNNQTNDDTLTDITGTGVTVSLGKPVTVPAAGLVNLADSGQVSVEGTSVVPGGYVDLTLVFSSGQSTEMKVPVVVHAGDYAHVPLPSASPTGAAGGKPSATATPTQ